MVGPLGVVVSPFRPTFRIEGREPHHHVEAARRWCRTDSQSALILLSSVPAFLQPKSFWDISDSLCSRVALSFQWVPGHAGLPGYERADSLAKTRATLPVTHGSLPPDSDYCKD